MSANLARVQITKDPNSYPYSDKKVTVSNKLDRINDAVLRLLSQWLEVTTVYVSMLWSKG